MFLVSLPFSCGSNDQNPCIIESPLESIAWLKEYRQNLELSEVPGNRIVQYVYNDECVFLIDACHHCPDAIIHVFDYDGNVVCAFGGIAGLDTCPDFYDAASDEKVLWELK